MRPVTRSMLVILLLLVGFTAAAAADATEILVVLNKSDHTASLLDPESGELLAVIATGMAPHEVAVSPDGVIAVVANYGTRGRAAPSRSSTWPPAGWSRPSTWARTAGPTASPSSPTASGWWSPPSSRTASWW